MYLDPKKHESNSSDYCIQKLLYYERGNEQTLRQAVKFVVLGTSYKLEAFL